MPTIFTHAFAAYTLSKTFFTKVTTQKLYTLVIICAMIPDADVVGFQFGVSYNSMFGHRGFTHSIFFAAILAMVVKVIFFYSQSFTTSQGRIIFLSLFLATVSHPLLDMLTNGGLGVALFAPFSNQRYFCPWFTPVDVSPIGAANFFTKWGLSVLISEIKFIIFPCVIILLCAKLLNTKGGTK
ncbi:MAG TPA: metal-dependent hydrolase [Bacteroidia bacterium]|nr:metal-dependent hydrolase [Bacteroidia bacterium]